MKIKIRKPSSIPHPPSSRKARSPSSILYPLSSRKGQLLIEAMIAITIITVGLLGVFTLLSRSQSLNRVVSDRYVATYLSAEGVELVKNLIDTNYIQQLPWNSGLASGSYKIDYNDGALTSVTGPLLYDLTEGIYGYDSGSPSRFTRLIQISYPGGTGDEMRVNSVVNWTTRGGGEFSVNLEDHFFNWRL